MTLTGIVGRRRKTTIDPNCARTVGGSDLRTLDAESGVMHAWGR